MSINTLIVTGNGINCENETANVFMDAGAKTTILHLDDFLELESLEDYDILAFPGGFSYGDEIRSGKIVAELIKINQSDNIQKFIDNGKPIIGICNGFQILIQLDIFGKEITLSENISGKFINKWVTLSLRSNESFWFNNINSDMYMPIRHKEGRIIGNLNNCTRALSYSDDINGSIEQLAALTNSKGNVLGIMPHPEAATHSFLLPIQNDKQILNQQLFKNAVIYSGRLKNEKSIN